MTAADASVAIAAFASWHESHALVVEALRGQRTRLVAHCGLETYSVLTRLPEPHRAGSAEVVEFLRRRFPDPHLVLPVQQYQGLVPLLADLGVTGGAVYDGLVAFSARGSGAPLLTLDRRAVPTYVRCQADCRVLAPPGRG